MTTDDPAATHPDYLTALARHREACDAYTALAAHRDTTPEARAEALTACEGAYNAGVAVHRAHTGLRRAVAGRDEGARVTLRYALGVTDARGRAVGYWAQIVEATAAAADTPREHDPSIAGVAVGARVWVLYRSATRDGACFGACQARRVFVSLEAAEAAADASATAAQRRAWGKGDGRPPPITVSRAP